MHATTGTLILVTADDCHLCEHGHEVLSGLGIDAREVVVDCDEAAALAARGLPLGFLPVLTDGTRLIAYAVNGRKAGGRVMGDDDTPLRLE